MADHQLIREYFSVYETAYLREFGMLGFDEPGGNHTPSPFLGVNKCIGQLVRDGTIQDKPVLVLGSGDSRINVAFNSNGRDSYGLESNISAYRMGLLAVKALSGNGLIKHERPIVLGHGNFFDASSYEQLGLPFEAFSTLYHNDGTGDFRHIQSVADLVVHESQPGTVLLLASHNGIPFAFDGLSCSRTHRIWGRKNCADGMYIHVYKKIPPAEETKLRRKSAHQDAFAEATGASLR